MSGISEFAVRLNRGLCHVFGTLTRTLLLGGIVTTAHAKGKQLLDLELVSFIEPPYVFQSDTAPTGEVRGLATAIVDELLNSTGVSYQLKLLPPKRAIIYASQTPNTCVYPIERNQEREVQFNWISPILISRSGLYPLAGRPVEKKLEALVDAKQLRIGSHLGSATGEYLRSLGYEVDSASQGDANAYKLQFDRIDVWASDHLTAAYTAQTSGIKLGPSAFDFFTTLRAIGCHSSVSTQWIEKLSARLYAMYKDGSIEKLRSRLEKSIVLMPPIRK